MEHEQPVLMFPAIKLEYGLRDPDQFQLGVETVEGSYACTLDRKQAAKTALALMTWLSLSVNEHQNAQTADPIVARDFGVTEANESSAVVAVDVGALLVRFEVPRKTAEQALSHLAQRPPA